MQQACRQCQSAFEITDADRAFLAKMTPTFAGKKFPIPDPTLCPDCREQRRQAAVNQLHLYKRTCGKTGKPIVSNFHPSSPYVIYAQDVWWEDGWDGLQYGHDFDFSRPFFEQYRELCLTVPHPSLMTGYQYDENCDYTNYAGKNKNCYLLFDADENRDCYYSCSINSCVNCMDCLRARRCELCYGVIDAVNCYGSSFLQDCDNCSGSMFLKNCTGCTNCIMCVNLKTKEYHVENKPVTKEEFEQIRSQLSLRSALESAQQHFNRLKTQFPQKYMHSLQCENVSGDYLLNSKNAYRCYDSEQLHDCRYMFQAFMPVKDSMDCEQCGDGELFLECSNYGYNTHFVTFGHSCLENTDCHYSTFCFHCKNVFGCCGLKRKQYCVFNKQYTKEEYEQLVSKIIEHTKSTPPRSDGATEGQAGEYGEFFPITDSRFAYNESLAQDWYPLTKEQALERGYGWRDDEEKATAPQTYVVPDSIGDVSDDILSAVLVCADTGRQFKIIEQELAFYRNQQLPIPSTCFLARQAKRRSIRNPRILFDRTCMKCQKPIETTYAPDRPETVYCEQCYLEAVY